MKKVVVIEDQTALREMISQVVRTQPGFEVVAESGDGHTAYKTCIEHRPDLVILDIMLPGLNGAEVLRRFSKRLKNTRVLVFSGYYNKALVSELIKAGAHGYVEKSASLSEVREGIKTVAAGGTYFSPKIAKLLCEAVAKPESQKPSIDSLTAREREVLQLIAESYPNRKISIKLNISIKTVENHRANLMNKLNLHNVAGLTRYAIEHGLIEPPGGNNLL